MEQQLHTVLQAIEPTNKTLDAKAKARLDELSKPNDSLGRLEELARQIYCIQNGVTPITADPARIYTVAGDHGVNAEGVSVVPSAVTYQMTCNFLRGGAGINVLADTAGAELMVVDAGTLAGEYPDSPRLLKRRIANGTANIAKGPAMSRQQCLQALLLGIELAEQAAQKGIRAVGTGEMGISNTTPSTALFSAFLHLEPDTITGTGGGISKETVLWKTRVIKQALAANNTAIKSNDAIAILAALGGLEIATITGLIIGSARHRLIAVIDGFISTAAYVAAWKLCPAVKDYCIFSHTSAERGFPVIAEALDIYPLLDLGLRLGEGTGSAVAMFLLRAGCNIFNDMATFSEAKVIPQHG